MRSLGAVLPDLSININEVTVQSFPLACNLHTNSYIPYTLFCFFSVYQSCRGEDMDRFTRTFGGLETFFSHRDRTRGRRRSTAEILMYKIAGKWAGRGCLCTVSHCRCACQLLYRRWRWPLTSEWELITAYPDDWALEVECMKVGSSVLNIKPSTFFGFRGSGGANG